MSNTKTVTVYPTEGEPFAAEAELTEGELDLQWLYKTIGCDRVQMIYVPGGTLWFDEEGKYKRPLVANQKANEKFGHVLFVGDFLAGVCVFEEE